MHVLAVSHFWKDEYCVRHGSDGTPQCDSCGRMRAKGAPDFLPVDDNRAICHPCTATVLMDTLEARPLYNQVLEFFKSKGMALVRGHRPGQHANITAPSRRPRSGA